MGYSIAYNSGTTTPFGTYKQGTITMGLKPDEYTVSSGFTWYANAETPNDNYLIISDTYSQGWSTQAESKPTIWRSETGTTESFVSLVNQLPDVNGVTGFTDSGNAMKHLIDSGKYFVNKDDYLGIISDDLVFNLDAGWYLSYSGSGTTWKDIKGTNNGTFNNGPTFSTEGGGSIVFDGADDYIELGSVSSSNPLSLYNTDFTVSFWFKPEGIGDIFQRLIDKSNGTSMQNGWGVVVTSNGNLSKQLGFYIDRQSVVINNDFNFGNWYNIVFTKNGSTMKMYNNTVLKGTNSSCPTVPSTTTGCRIGAWPADTARCYDGYLSNLFIYHKELTQEEITQNYNATKGRFGL